MGAKPQITLTWLRILVGPHSSTPEPILFLNGDGPGLVNNCVWLSNVASTYAPPGQALLSVSVLGIPGTPFSARFEDGNRILRPRGVNGLKILSSTRLLVQTTLPTRLQPQLLPPPTPEQDTERLRLKQPLDDQLCLPGLG